MENDVVIRVSHVSKQYRLGMIGSTTLREEMQRKLAKLRKKEDPTKAIGLPSEKNVGDLFYALDDISFEIKKGEAVGIIGHNGAGKSTILKLISQVTGPTTGTIELDGRVTSMLEVGTGFHDELSGRENIYMNGAILGMSRQEIDSKIEDIIDFSECRKFIDTPVKRYSSGMFVKLGFSVAAHLDSEIMIMDEVLAVGDAKFQEKCLGRMGSEAHGGRTILYVSHNMNTIRTLCDRVIVLDHGKKIYDGDVEQGVGIYNGLKQLSPVVVSMDDCWRSVNYANRVFSINELTVDAEASSFAFGSKVKGTISIQSPEEKENIGFFFQIKSISETRVTRMNTGESMVLSEGENRYEFDWDVSGLIPGKYMLGISLVEKNSWGNEQILDQIPEAYCFEITTDTSGGLFANWNPQAYGYYVGPDLRTNRI